MLSPTVKVPPTNDAVPNVRQLPSGYPSPHEPATPAPPCVMVITNVPTVMVPVRDAESVFWVTVKLTVDPLDDAVSHPPVALTTGAPIAQPDCVTTVNEPVAFVGPSVATDVGLKLYVQAGAAVKFAVKVTADDGIANVHEADAPQLAYPVQFTKANPLFGVAVTVIDSPNERCEAPLGTVPPPAPAMTDNVYVVADDGTYVAVTVMLAVPGTVQTLAAPGAQPTGPVLRRAQ